ncbi:MAG: hypothetical protein HFG81_12000 [Dorea sp.]|nr:hypothetical protein [Dorea sp.]
MLRKQYEIIVLAVDIYPLPILGKEVSEKYGISGKQLEIIMKKVKDYYNNHPNIEKEELMFYIESIL